MSKAMAESIVCRVFEGTREEDDVFHQALEIVGMSRQQFRFLRREARKCERRQPRFMINTPTGSGKRQ